jgi:aldose 1-epimerase
MGQDYQLSTPTPSAHALHGFAMGKSWQILDKSETDENASIRCEFTIAENDFQGYAFNVRVESVFTLSESGFTHEITALNIGEGPLPLTMGVTPYLTVAKSPADRIDFWELQFQAKSMLVLDDGIPTGEMRDVSGTALDFTRMLSIDGSVFDQGFADLTYCGEKARSIIRNPETGLEVELWQDSGFGYVQVYTLPPRANISIEPTSGAADAFNNGIGLTVLGPGEERSASYGIRIIH